ncbi:methyltransferase [Belnapia sp. T18]|uniref:Methyltransferase n=1 Tax=Belnapia arida TaxID=2804533 RepID=A0ABS1TZN6_9PROT|nr:class I SAM-dependent methyltransferase [Belnapia arida]MBL6077888.1 methyltransferase [Belnapia arida]
MSAALAREVAGLYAGASRFARGYVSGKLRTDPASRVVLERAAGKPFGMVADLGCGRGQLGLALLMAGRAREVVGLDRDARKIVEAQAAAARLPARFTAGDLTADSVPDCDTALLIDVLYQLPAEVQRPVLAAVAARARRQVLIRAFDPARGWRSALGLAMERAGRLIRGDSNAIAPLPMEELAAPFRVAGFAVTVTPCWEGTPLPNVLLAAER